MPVLKVHMPVRHKITGKIGLIKKIHANGMVEVRFANGKSNDVVHKSKLERFYN